MPRIAINGAAGRMGLRLIDLGLKDPELDVVAGWEHPEHPKLGTDLGVLVGAEKTGILLSHQSGDDIEVAIDFSSPESATFIIQSAEERRCGLVMATTGLTEQAEEQLRRASQKIPIVWAPNMSLAVNVAMKLSEMTGKALKHEPNGVDVEIIERHHRFKADSPSGTALKFGELIAATMGQTTHRHGREGQVGQRPKNEIGYHAVRTGDDAGQHTIVFGMLGETIEIRVAASNRDCYANGAFAAAKFLSDKTSGLYSMYDVLDMQG